MQTRSGRWAAAAVLAVVGTAAAGFWWLCSFDVDIPFLTARGEAEWIVYPDAGIGGARPTVEVGGVFRRSFEVASRPPSATLCLRALERARLSLNGRSVPVPRDPASWKDPRRVDVAPWLREGANELSVEVVNGYGPPALWLELELPDGRLRTDREWEVSWAGAAWQRAALAREARGRIFDPERRVERVAPSIGVVWPWLLLIAAVVPVTVMVSRFAQVPIALRRDPLRLTLVVAAVAWVALFANNADALRRVLGFDSGAHLDYVAFILEHASLPLADDGWQMYQPPLYYLAVAVLWRVGGWAAQEPAAVVALRLFNLGLALVTMGFVLTCLRRVFPRRPAAQWTGLAFAAFLPACLYLFHYPTNEGMVIATSAVTLWACLRLVQAEAPSTLDFVLLGGALGAALLSKVSALLLGPVAAGAVVYRIRIARDETRRRCLAGAAVAAIVLLAVCGWYYGRVWIHFGSPLMGNWDPASGFGWWQHPGYRTVHDYLRFGRSLVEPAFAGFDGAWDGFYSTLWGDGLYGGKNGVPFRPPWNYHLMTAGYLLAIVPTVLMLTGAAVALRRFLRRPDATWAVLLGVVVLTLSGMVYMTLKVPSYAQCKAFYGLIALVPLSALVAAGADALSGRHPALRLLVATGLVTWAVTAYASYWVDGDGAAARRARAKQTWSDGDRIGGARSLRALVSADPDDWESRLMLAELLRREARPTPSELRALLEPARPLPDLARRHAEIGWLYLLEGRAEAALEAARRAVALEPDLVDIRLLHARALWETGSPEGSVQALREALRIDPGDVGIHVSLANSLMLLGRLDEAERQCRIALLLEPGFALARDVLDRIVERGRR